ncbi:MAG TPA: Hsp20/alpha crystallin family protein [Syntrophorhabdaceae bacterium]|nr:Hsp20/alpha crystallin family protein [Syntrophorhabdaceae bacterium]
MAEKDKVQKSESEGLEKVERTRAVRVFNPDVDIIERKSDIVVIADMPGIDEGSIDLTLENNVLSIYGRVDWEVPGDLRLVRAEYNLGDYQRTFTLSGDIDKGKIEAVVTNGVLKITLPKAEAAKTKKIPVKAAA